MPGREEALNRARGYFASVNAGPGERVRNVKEMRDRFIGKWFPNGDEYTSPELNIHDAAHQFASVSPTPRGEAQQFFVDVQGTNLLAGQTGATGFANSLDHRRNGRIASEIELDGITEDLRQRYNYTQSDQTRHLVEKDGQPVETLSDKGWRDAWNKSSSMDEVNSPKRTYRPPISREEVEELRRRGRQFYGQVADSWRGQTDLLGVDTTERVVPAVGTLNVSPVAAAIHDNSDAIQIRGGYDKPGALPFGPVMQHVQYPEQRGVDVAGYRKEASRRALADMGNTWNAGSDDEGYKRLILQGKTDLASDYLKSRREGEFLGAASKATDVYGTPDGGPMLYGSQKDPKKDFNIKPVYETEIDRWTREYPEGKRAPLLTIPRSKEAGEILAGLHERDRVAGAIGRGYRAAGNALSALPLADPEFQQAIDQRQGVRAAAITARNAGAQVVGQYATGAAAGLLQRTAPEIATRVLPAASLIGNVAGGLTWATMAPGSTPQPRQVGSYRGAPVWQHGDGTMVSDPGQRLGGPTRVGRARLNGKEVFVPWGSAAGTAVGPKTVGRPWWDGGAQRAASSLQRQAVEALSRGAAAASSGYQSTSRTVNHALGMPNTPTAGNELRYIFGQLGQGRLPYQR